MLTPYIIKVCTLCCFILVPNYVLADTPVHPFSYSTASADGKFLFVMIAPVSFEEDGEFADDESEARAKYLASGLYLNDGSTKPLWTVEWYATLTWIAADGIHLIREKYPPAESLDDEALTIFANGKELRTYKVGDFIDTATLVPRTTAYVLWVRNIKLDDEKRTLLLTTSSNEEYVIDYTTGEIVSSRRPVRAVTVIVVVVFAALAFFLARKARRV